MSMVIDDTNERFILDTNIWLDWFVFAQAPDSAIAQLKQYISQRRNNCQVLMTPAMWDAWADVLGRVQFSIDPERQQAILRQTREIVQLVDTPPIPRQRIRCIDADDQMFIDAALNFSVSYLISKDRHLLKLRSRARPYHVWIGTPEDWLKREGDIRSTPSEKLV